MIFNHTFVQENNCEKGKLSCFTTRQCVDEDKWCDSNVDCEDASDETACTCKSRLDPSRICDGFVNEALESFL